MKAFTFATVAIAAGVSTVAAAAMDPRPSPAALQKRQDSPVDQITGLLNPLTEYITNEAIATLVASIAGNPDFAAAVGAAGQSDYAPIESLVASFQADEQVSSAIYGALGTESADAFYASASDAIGALASETAAADPTATDDETATETSETATETGSETATETTGSETATSTGSTTAATGPAATTSAPASGALSMAKAGNVLPAVMVVFGVAAGAILL